MKYSKVSLLITLFWAARLAHSGRSKHVWCSTGRPFLPGATWSQYAAQDESTTWGHQGWGGCSQHENSHVPIFIYQSSFWTPIPSPGPLVALKLLSVPHHFCKYLHQTLCNAVQEHAGTHSALLSAIDPRYPSTTPWDPSLLTPPARAIWWGWCFLWWCWLYTQNECIIMYHSDVHCDDDQGDNDPSGTNAEACIWLIYSAPHSNTGNPMELDMCRLLNASNGTGSRRTGLTGRSLLSNTCHKKSDEWPLGDTSLPGEWAQKLQHYASNTCI